MIATSAIATAVCIAVAMLVWFVSPDIEQEQVPWWVGALILVIIPTSLLFTIRGYAIARDTIEIRRLLWTTRIPRTGIQSATHDPAAMQGGWRVMGNGGMFSFTGLYHSRRLGSYRAYVTDPARSVVLTFRDRIVVVTPDDPERFAHDVMSRA